MKLRACVPAGCDEPGFDSQPHPRRHFPRHRSRMPGHLVRTGCAARPEAPASDEHPGRRPILWPPLAGGGPLGLWRTALSERLRKIVDRFSRVTVLVLGDFLLDEYVFGEISRVSREAPVLILSYQETHCAPGGGANTVAGIDAMGARVLPVGCIGNDSWGDQLLSLWPARLSREGVLRFPEVRTTRKCRILAGSVHSFRQQVVRMDYENHASLSEQRRAQVKDRFRRLAPKADAFIISDYSQGMIDGDLRRLAIDLARERKRPLVVDSRFDPGGFRGATAVTPNISEVEHALGRRISDGELPEIGNRLLRDWQLEALLITRGKLGMSLFGPQGTTEIPIYGTDQVVDVTGAGDTVIATFTTALAAGADYREAAILANCAGGVVVTKRGTATVSQAELREAAASQPGSR